MSVTLSIIISLLALLATFYQLYLQRVHNEKSLKPLGQIQLSDRGNLIAVHLCNNGLGPMIIDRLTFKKSDNIYSSIKDCLDLDPKSFMHSSSDDAVKRVILPGGNLTVFGTTFEDDEAEAAVNYARIELSTITLKVDCWDIYDNKFTIERDFKWFCRYMSVNKHVSKTVSRQN